LEIEDFRKSKGNVGRTGLFWVKRLFEEALGREVNVEIEQSILWGDKECRIRIDK